MAVSRKPSARPSFDHLPAQGAAAMRKLTRLVRKDGAPMAPRPSTRLYHYRKTVSTALTYGASVRSVFNVLSDGGKCTTDLKTFRRHVAAMEEAFFPEATDERIAEATAELAIAQATWSSLTHLVEQLKRELE